MKTTSPPKSPKAHELSEEDLPDALAPVLRALAGKPKERLEDLIPLFKGSPRATASLALCYETAFHGMDTSKANSNFRKLREAVNKIAATLVDDDKGETPVKFECDTGKGDPAKRIVWFTGPDPKIAQLARIAASAERFSVEGVADLMAPNFQPPFIEQFADMGREHPIFNVFVSYARANKRYMNKLIDDLERHLRDFSVFRFNFWRDARVLSGNKKQKSKIIIEQINLCHFGLLLVSPDYLESDFIWEHEAPRFVGPHPDKPCFLPGISKINFADRTEPKVATIAEKMVTLLQEDGGERLHWYNQCGRNQAERFAEQLAKHIDKRIHEGQKLAEKIAKREKADPRKRLEEASRLAAIATEFPELLRARFNAALVTPNEVTNERALPDLQKRGTDGCGGPHEVARG